MGAPRDPRYIPKTPKEPLFRSNMRSNSSSNVIPFFRGPSQVSKIRGGGKRGGDSFHSKVRPGASSRKNSSTLRMQPKGLKHKAAAPKQAKPLKPEDKLENELQKLEDNKKVTPMKSKPKPLVLDDTSEDENLLDDSTDNNYGIFHSLANTVINKPPLMTPTTHI